MRQNSARGAGGSNARRAVCLALALAFALTLSLPAYAGDVRLTAAVPGSHTITVICGEHGTARAAGVEFTGTRQFTVKRFDSFAVSAAAEPGYLTDVVTSDFPGGMTLTQDGAAVDRVYGDMRIRVNFTPDAQDVPFYATSDDGELIAGAALTLTWEGETGRYLSSGTEDGVTIPLLRGRPYTYVCEMPGYAPTLGAFTPSSSEGTVRVVLCKYRVVTLRLLSGGTPVSGAGVTVAGETVATDDAGTARFTLINGAYDALLALPDGRSTLLRVDVSGDTVQIADIGLPEGDGAQLYDRYLGAAGGESDLFIVYDEHYAPVDYRVTIEAPDEDALLAALPDSLDETERKEALAALRSALPNVVRVVVQPETRVNDQGDTEVVTDENGEPIYVHRNLLLSGEQLLRVEEQSIQRLIVESGDFAVSFALADPRNERLCALIAQLYEHGAPPASADLTALEGVTTWLDALPAGQSPVLTRDMYAAAAFEVRVTPVLKDEWQNARFAGVSSASGELLLAPGAWISDQMRADIDGGRLTWAEAAALGALAPASCAYRARVFITVNGVEVDITSLMDTVEVSVAADALLEQEERALAAEGAAGDLSALAQKRLLSRYTLAAVVGESGDYAPNSASLLPLTTRLTNGAQTDEQALAALAATIAEDYNVSVQAALGALAGDTRYIAQVQGGAQRGRSSARWLLTARAPAGGVYLAVTTP